MNCDNLSHLAAPVSGDVKINLLSSIVMTHAAMIGRSRFLSSMHLESSDVSTSVITGHKTNGR
jgi:hypothetical protein